MIIDITNNLERYCKRRYPLIKFKRKAFLTEYDIQGICTDSSTLHSSAAMRIRSVLSNFEHLYYRYETIISMTCEIEASDAYTDYTRQTLTVTGIKHNK